jgi:thermitase
MRKIIAILLVLCCFWQAFAHNRAGNPARYAPGQLLVKFREGVSPVDQAWVRHLIGAKVLDVKPNLGIELWQVSPFTDVPALCRQLLRSGWVEIADPNWELQLADWTPNDPLYGQQPALPHIGCPQAWDYWRGSNQFIAAVLDTGTLLTHPDLQAKLLPGWDFGNDDNDPSDPFGHGTYVTGITGAVTNNGIGVACIAPEGKVLPVKVFTDAGQGYLNDLIDGVNYAVAQGAHVINLSLGSASAMPSLQTALNNAWNAGVVIVAAAGNNNNTNPFYPAYYPVCIAVAASNLDDTKSDPSTYGSWVDVAAPSGDVYSTTRGRLQSQQKRLHLLRRPDGDRAGVAALSTGGGWSDRSLAGTGTSGAHAHRIHGGASTGQLCGVWAHQHLSVGDGSAHRAYQRAYHH